jgi:hypothetical protein
LKEIDHRLDVKEGHTLTGHPEVVIRIPSLKNQRGDVRETHLVDEAYEDFMAWLRKRRKILMDSRFLFVTRTGTQVSAESISMGLDSLSQYAGYAPKFFSSHSGRMSFGCRMAAKCFSEGRSLTTVYEKMGVTKLWTKKSSSIPQYIDEKVSHYFEGDCRLSWQEFQEADPVALHGLSHLSSVKRKHATWFSFSCDELIQAANSLGGSFTSVANQNELKKFIVKAVFRVHPNLMQWFQEYFPINIKVACYERLVYSLLDNRLIGLNFVAELHHQRFLEVARKLDLRDLYQEPRDPTQEPCPIQAARRLRKIEIVGDDHEQYLLQLFQRRTNDRMLTYGIRQKDQTIRIINANSRERNTTDFKTMLDIERSQSVTVHNQPSTDTVFHQVHGSWLRALNSQSANLPLAPGITSDETVPYPVADVPRLFFESDADDYLTESESESDIEIPLAERAMKRRRASSSRIPSE